MTNRRRQSRERGAAAVELALIAPLLFTILFGIVEFGWTFSQVLDVRHGAREGARLAAVNYRPADETGSAQTDQLVATICGRVDDPDVTRVSLSFETSGATGAGDTAVIHVERDLEQLSGFFDPMLKGISPDSEVTFRLEQPADWAETTGFQSCP
jgi:hypothetical protein